MYRKFKTASHAYLCIHDENPLGCFTRKVHYNVTNNAFVKLTSRSVQVRLGIFATLQNYSLRKIVTNSYMMPARNFSLPDMTIHEYG
jgi:hypothetical protein